MAEVTPSDDRRSAGYRLYESMTPKGINISLFPRWSSLEFYFALYLTADVAYDDVNHVEHKQVT